MAEQLLGGDLQALVTRLGDLESQTAEVTGNLVTDMSDVKQQLQNLAQSIGSLHSLVAAREQQQQAAASQPPASGSAAPQVHRSVLPSAVRPEKPEPFEGKMDGDTIQTFIHKLSLYFSLTGLQDPQQQATFAATLLTKSAYTWFVAQGYDHARLHWAHLKHDLRQHFRPLDYSFQSREALANCKQTGHLLGYIRAFRQALVRCDDVTDEEALFRFVFGLKREEQRLVRLQRPQNLAQAAEYAEQIASTLGGTESTFGHNRPQQHQRPQNNNQNQPQRPQQFRGQVQMRTYGGQGRSGFGQSGPNRVHNGPVPMELGTMRFNGNCHNCGKAGHKAANCRSRPQNQGPSGNFGFRRPNSQQYRPAQNRPAQFNVANFEQQQNYSNVLNGFQGAQQPQAQVLHGGYQPQHQFVPSAGAMPTSGQQPKNEQYPTWQTMH